MFSTYKSHTCQLSCMYPFINMLSPLLFTLISPKERIYIKVGSRFGGFKFEDQFGPFFVLPIAWGYLWVLPSSLLQCRSQ